MKQWLSEFRASWQDKNFICAAIIFIFSYALIAAIGILLPTLVFTAIISAIAGWQIAGWSFRLAPKLKDYVFKSK